MIHTPNPDDDLLTFHDEEDDISDSKNQKPWKILVTDDDQAVHDTTAFALNGVTIQGRPIKLLHAFSALESRDMLLTNPEIAVILLDVVMETVDAGLRLVDAIRNELRLHNLRIVIRTGQPGGANTAYESYRAIVDAFTIKSKITRSALINVLEEMLTPPHPTQ